MSDKLIEYKGKISIGLVNCEREFSFEVEESASEEEIEKEAFEWMCNEIDWYYEKIDNDKG